MRARFEQKLAVILAADVAGYSRLMETDEAGTLATLLDCRRTIDRLIGSHKGRIFGTAGDSVIAEFGSVVKAVECAVKIQDAIEKRNAKPSASMEMQFRIGVHLGEVIVKRDNLYGEAVNIAARLQALAEPGTICVSAAVREQVGRKLPTTFTYMGEHQVKNIAQWISAFALQGQIATKKTQNWQEGVPSQSQKDFPVQVVRF